MRNSQSLQSHEGPTGHPQSYSGVAEMTRYRAGDEIIVQIDREGLGLGEGIGHLPDETMVVIVGASERVGETVEAVITGKLYTSLGTSLMASAKP